MGLLANPWLLFPFLVFSLLSFKAHCENDREPPLKFLKAPHAISHLNSATFQFQVLGCTNCALHCKLDNGNASDCGAKRVSYKGLRDGNHTFEVCSNRSRGVGCASYNWTIDTVPPTAYITASTSFTNALNFSVNVTFSEPCGGFHCSSVNACNLLVYGAGKVIPSSLTILEPNIKYSLMVELSSTVAYGRVALVMDKDFCTDTAGNIFTRPENPALFVHFDRRSVFADLRLHIPEKLLQLDNQTRTVLATNNHDKLKVYLYFTEPVLNSSAEILDSVNLSEGALLPIRGENLGSRRFGFQVVNFSSIAIITIDIQSNSIISRPGTSISPVSPVTFLYDSERSAVRLSTTSNARTKDHIIPVSIKFMKPVFGFNSSLLSISGGHLHSFREVTRSKYVAEVHADGESVLISVPENVTGDVAGNKNLASNVLQVRHYCVPTVSFVISTFATVVFVATSSASGLLTVSTASLQSVGAFPRRTSTLVSNPARILFRIVCYIQVFALSRWLAVKLPVEYYEFARGIQWSIPYFSLPWENEGIRPIMLASNSSSSSRTSHISEYHAQSVLLNKESSNIATPVYGLPLTPMEYKSYFETQFMNPEAEYISDPQNSNGWRIFGRTMFWLAVVGGSLILLHVILLILLKYRKNNSEKPMDYGALTFPRFEIFLIMLSLPCVSAASAAIVKGGTQSGELIGILLLVIVGFLVFALFLFLSIGITFGKLLQYKEVHQEGQKFHWYQDIIRVSLGPGKRGQWTWKYETNSNYLTMFGPLFEDLRGPPKYMLSVISGSDLTNSNQKDRIIVSDDETEDAEAPFIQKLFGILRIYYTLLETVRRVLLGIIAGAYLDIWSSVTPTIILLSITSFQLFFLGLKKPFVKKKVQLVEIITVSCQLCLFSTCFILEQKKLTTETETKVGIFMILLFVVGFLAEMMNEWYALYRQTKVLDPAKKCFSTGIKAASIGFLLYFAPQKMCTNLESKLAERQLRESSETRESSSSVDRNKNSRSRSSSNSDHYKPWTKQLREMAKASFTSGRERVPSDPSTSRSKWGGFYASKSSDASSKNSSDFKSKPSRLYKDLEAIFAAK